jgi:hypothetical protein
MKNFTRFRPGKETDDKFKSAKAKAAAKVKKDTATSNSSIKTDMKDQQVDTNIAEGLYDSTMCCKDCGDEMGKPTKLNAQCMYDGKDPQGENWIKKESYHEEVKHSDMHVKQAIGIATDPRYKGGNMTGAVKTMNKLSKNIHKHPKVAAVLKRVNEAYVALDEKYKITKMYNPTTRKSRAAGVSTATYAVHTLDRKYFKEFPNQADAEKHRKAKMNEAINHTVNIDHTGGPDSAAKKHNIALKKAKYGTDASGKKKDLQKYLAHHYDSQSDAKDLHPKVYEAASATKTIDKVKQIVSKKQAMKIDGVMVDMFTASAISQIYDKVNDANKKKMDGLKVTQLASIAMKMMKRESTLDEASKEGTIKIIKTKDNRFQVQRMTKGKFVNQGKPYKSAKDAEKMRSSGQHSMQFSHVDEGAISTAKSPEEKRRARELRSKIGQHHTDTAKGQRAQTVGTDWKDTKNKERAKMGLPPVHEDTALNELTAAEKKLINQMYDKKGNLTPMGKKVMDHGKANRNLTPQNRAADNARRKEYNAYQKSKRNEEVDLSENAFKMKLIDKMKKASPAAKKALEAPSRVDKKVNELTIADVNKATAAAKKRQAKERETTGKSSVSSADLAARQMATTGNKPKPKTSTNKKPPADWAADLSVAAMMPEKQVNELSPAVRQSYRKKAMASYNDAELKRSMANRNIGHPLAPNAEKDVKKADKVLAKRRRGADLFNKQKDKNLPKTGKDMNNEEMTDLNLKAKLTKAPSSGLGKKMGSDKLKADLAAMKARLQKDNK